MDKKKGLQEKYGKQPQFAKLNIIDYCPGVADEISLKSAYVFQNSSLKQYLIYGLLTSVDGQMVGRKNAAFLTLCSRDLSENYKVNLTKNL